MIGKDILEYIIMYLIFKMCNSLMEQKNSGIIKDFKFSPISINEHHTTLKEFIKKYGDISIADLAVLLKALED